MRELFFEIYQRDNWLVSGGCPKGGDRFAEVIAKSTGIPILIFYPDWESYGKRAGFERNTRIAEYSQILIARVTPDRKGGTEDTIKKFKKQEGKRMLYLVHDDKIESFVITGGATWGAATF